MTNQEWLNTLDGVTDTLILNCCCAGSKCSTHNDCNVCVSEWLKSEHGECSMYEVAEKQCKPKSKKQRNCVADLEEKEILKIVVTKLDSTSNMKPLTNPCIIVWKDGKEIKVSSIKFSASFDEVPECTITYPVIE